MVFLRFAYKDYHMSIRSLHESEVTFLSDFTNVIVDV